MERTSPPTQRSLHCGHLDHLTRQAGGGHAGHAVEAEVLQPVDEEADHHLLVGQEEQDCAMISSMISALLAQEEAALGLAQPHDFGQRPKQLAVDLSTGLPACGQEEAE
jgi:hypothetical protein